MERLPNHCLLIYCVMFALQSAVIGHFIRLFFLDTHCRNGYKQCWIFLDFVCVSVMAVQAVTYWKVIWAPCVVRPNGDIPEHMLQHASSQIQTVLLNSNILRNIYYLNMKTCSKHFHFIKKKKSFLLLLC